MKKTSHARTKVLIVITKSNWGGAQQYVYTLAKHLAENGTDVVLALGGTGSANSDKGELATRLSKKNIRTIFIHSFTRDISLLREVHAFFNLLRIIRKERPDVLHLNSSKAGGLGALAGRIANVPHIIFTAHGWPHEEPRGIISRTIIWLASYVTVLLCNTVIVLSKQQKTNAPAFFMRNKLHIIPNGVEDFEMLTRENARALFIAKKPSLKNYSKWVMSISELHKNKGVDTLLDAFSQIYKSHPNTALVLIHDGDEREALIKQTIKLGIADRVLFAGFVQNARATLKASDIFVLPSRKEGLPFVILEAGHAEVPVVASTVGGIPEIIQNNNTGLLISPNDTDALAKAIITILDNSLLAKNMAHALHEHVKQDFSAKQMLEMTLVLYKK